ncbi:hypothetical protein Btru_000838 [Bulinus truncatus]|nr:hypothetical protein Btru_000838 [Bulinus truncatus]
MLQYSGSQLNSRLTKQRLTSRFNTENQARPQQSGQANSPQENRISLTPQQLLKLDSLRLREQVSSDSSRQSRTQDVGQSDTYLLDPSASGQPQRQRYQSIDDLRSQQSLLERQELQLQLQRRQLQQQMSSYADETYAQQQPRNQQVKNAQQRQQTRVSQKQQQRYPQDQFDWQNPNDSQPSYQATQQLQYSDQVPNADLHAAQDRMIGDQASKQGQYSSRIQDQYGLDPSLQSVQAPKQGQFFSKSQPINPNQFLIVSEHPQNAGAGQMYDRMSVGQMNGQSAVDSGSSGYQSGPTDLRSNHMSSSSHITTGGLSRSSGLQGEIQQQSIQQYISQHPSRSSVTSGGGQHASGDQFNPGPHSLSTQSQMQGAYVQSVNQDVVGGHQGPSSIYDHHQHHPSLPSHGAVSGSTMNTATSGMALTVAGSSSGMGGAASEMGGAVSGMGGAVSGMGGAVSGMGGAVSGMGGAASGMGGAVSGMGGAASGMGGAASEMGGAVSGMGGAVSEMGGAVSGMGGAVSGMGGAASGMGGAASGMASAGMSTLGGGANGMGTVMNTHPTVMTGTAGPGMMDGAGVVGGAGMMGHGMMGPGVMGHGMMGPGMMGPGMMGHGMMRPGMMGHDMMGNGMVGHGMMGHGMMGGGMMGGGMMGGGMMGGFFPYMDMESPDSPDPTPAPPAPPSPAVVAPPPAVVLVSTPAVTAPPAVAVPAAVPLAPTTPPPSVNVAAAVAHAAVVQPEATAAAPSTTAVIGVTANSIVAASGAIVAKVTGELSDACWSLLPSDLSTQLSPTLTSRVMKSGGQSSSCYQSPVSPTQVRKSGEYRSTSAVIAQAIDAANKAALTAGTSNCSTDSRIDGGRIFPW